MIKQMNSKMKLDTYRIKYPSFFANTMIVGFDLVMDRSSKQIGCCSTYSKDLTQCYTRCFKQKHPRFTEEEEKMFKETKQFREETDRRTAIARTEIIREFMRLAVTEYRKANKTLPS
jgi:hypothetical protein